MNNLKVDLSSIGTSVSESAVLDVPIDIPTIDEILSLECKIRDIRQYYERQGVLNCMQKLQEHSQKLTSKNVFSGESHADQHRAFVDGFMQAHEIINTILRES